MARRPGAKKRHRWRQAFAWACDEFPAVGKPRLIITPPKQMEKDEKGRAIDGSYNPNNGCLRIRSDLEWYAGLATLWHELGHAINRDRCKLPDPGDHDVVHGLWEWMIGNRWHESGHTEADDYPARWD